MSRPDSTREAPAAPAFEPPWWLRGGMAQTIGAALAPRRGVGHELVTAARPSELPTPDGDRIRVHWSDAAPGSPVLVVLHGLTGCAASTQVLGVGARARAAGFTVARVDLRNALGETPSIGVGHAGRSEDVLAVLDHVRERAPGRAVTLVGFSLGGNVALKAAGELGASAPAELAAIVAISVPIDLDEACAAIDSSGNWIFRRYFLQRLSRIVARRRAHHPDTYGALDLDGIDSIREFDDRVVAPLCGFASAEDYYARSSALALMPAIRIPTLLVQAEDDPFVPFRPYRDARVADNPAVRLLATRRGGHAGFRARCGIDPDPHWAEHRAVEFCRAHVPPR